MNKFIKLSIIIFIVILIITTYVNKEGLTNNYKYTAVIIEPRKHKALEFVLQNFNDNLSDDWQFIVFHGTKNKEYTENICKKVFNPKRVKLINLNVNNLNAETYSSIFYDKSFYNIIQTETFLVFQTDSIICSKHKKLINNYLKYDYVGAPWLDGGGVGNGGLSLRKKSKMLEIVNNCKTKDDNGKYLIEDGVFSYGCKGIPIYKPSVKEATNFSIETYISNKSFGIHKAYAYLDSDEINDIKGWCPEITKLEKLNK